MMRSLQSRLLIGVICSIFGVLLVSGIAFYWLMRTALISEYDSSLSNEIRTLSALVKYEADGVRSDMADGEIPAFERSQRPEYYQIWQEDGTVLEKSRHLTDGDLPRLRGTLSQPKFQFLALPDGRPGRCGSVRFLPQLESEDDFDDDQEDTIDRNEEEAIESHDKAFSGSITPVTLTVTRDTIELAHTLGRIRWVLLIVFGGAACITLGVIAPVIRLGLRPLHETSREISRLDAQDLSSRIDSAHAPIEIETLINCLNQLLDRLEKVFRRERDFSAHVAHELRTPLAGLRSTMEVALARPRDTNAYQTVLRRCLEICIQTNTMIENLLSLARADAGRYEFAVEQIDLQSLVQEAWEPFAEPAGRKELRIHWKLNADTRLTSDPHVLRLILDNLYDNALSYTPVGATIQISSMKSAHGVVLSISNSGCPLAPGEVEFVFERFWRGERSRQQTGTHSGLGLAMCREFATLLGHSLVAEISHDGEFTVKLVFCSQPPTKNES
jgi:two-component system heavy metal sensor histidine kinase CusS